MDKYKNKPSELKNFKKVVYGALTILEKVPPSHFISPYSVVPIITQLLGLNTSLMGSGKSPYSLMSLVFYLNQDKTLFDQIFSLSIAQKRLIVDEIYDMIAPMLLQEENQYEQLLRNTKYYGIKIDLNHWQEKFDILRPLIKKYHGAKGDFCHIVHYGYLQDLFREYGFLENMPKDLALIWRQNSYPVVNEISLFGFPVAGEYTKKDLKGWIIFIPNYTKELLEEGKLRKEKIFKAAKLANCLGAKISGMGGLVASFAQGGQWLAKEFPDMGFTTGHAYTIGNIMEMLENCASKVNLNISQAKIAIVGAAGSIGCGCAKLISEKSPKELIFIDLNTFNVKEKLDQLQQYVNKVNQSIKVCVSNQLAEVKRADIIIVATNSSTAILPVDYLKPGAIIIDDSFPKNVSESVLKSRKDVILLEGGMMQLPRSIEVYSARNMPDLMDLPLTRVVSCKETYGCVAETLTLALYNYQNSYGLGQADPVLAKDILKKSKLVGFSLAPLQCFDQAVEEERFKKVSNIIEGQRLAWTS